MRLKHSKILFFQFLIALWLVSGGCQEARVGNDYYDLQFTERPGDGLRWGISCPSDSLDYICSWRKEALWSKDRSFFILQKPGKRLGASVGQLIPVYNKDCRKAVVRIRHWGRKLENAWLKVHVLDTEEKEFRRDSVDLRSEEKWEESVLEVPLENAAFLYIEITVFGKRVEKGDGAEIRIESVSVCIDGKEIEEDRLLMDKALYVKDTSRVYTFASLQDSILANLPLLNTGKKVMALGATVSGCSDMQHASYEMIKSMIQHQNCKLIMMELPSFVVLKWNLFIKGGFLKYEEFREDLSGTLTDPAEAWKWLKWLRAYNQMADKQVGIVGIQRGKLLSVPLIADYFYTLYAMRPHYVLRQWAEAFLAQRSKEVMELGRSDELRRAMGEFEYLWFRKAFQLYANERFLPELVDLYGSVANAKGYLEWLHARYALEIGLEEGECAVLAGSWKSLNKLNGVGVRIASLGDFLNKQLGEDYGVIGLLGGEGTFNALKKGQLTEHCELKSPEKGSLEELGMKEEMPFAYWPASALSGAAWGIRVQNHHYNTSYPVSLFRTDGFLFIKQCMAWDFYEGEIRNEEDYKALAEKRFRAVKEKLKRW